MDPASALLAGLFFCHCSGGTRRATTPTMRAGKLDGKVALVTGGDSGIGRAMAVRLAREGADVAVVYPPEEDSDARETERAIQVAGRRCVLLPGDVTSAEFCRRAVADTVKELSRLDILVNHAALFACFYMTKAALHHIPRGGRIINAGTGRVPTFTQSLARMLEDAGIGVSCVDAAG
jgi:lactate dehydrogenase-like 2-hydroxyacid dehydrogenase